MTRPAKRTTSQDVARAAGVSRTTVSFVLNDRPGLSIPEETRRRVLDAAKNLDYRPHASARALAAGRSDVVLLSVPDLPMGSGISRFVEELTAALATSGLTLVTHLAGTHGRPLPDVCASIDASAVLGLEPFDDEATQALRRAGADVVIPSSRMDPVSPTGLIGTLQAEHLIARGHRRIGYALPAQPRFRTMAQERLQSVMDACATAGVEPPLVMTTGLEIAGAAHAVAEWAEHSVTAVCAYNDETAIAVLAGMRETGLSAPADLAVIGADDIPTARLASPPLTTVCFDLHETGKQRAEAVVAGLAGREYTPPPATVAPRVVQRSST
ncbi:LacI family DNA-binding transcriptional regulator [Streptomyces sp. NPDC050392]|uniref:LacI family DNA-binding transcriptional regulator n=1 Tax=Streptomyces sp. NPDC050392 TaxID=3155782 RepID=UPI0034221F7E